MLRSLLFVVAALTIGLAAQPASAQSFHFGIGGGGHGHHHHHDHGWHFDYHDHYWHDHYHPRYVYVQPAPIVRERVTYVERAPSVARIEPPLADTLITVQNAAGKSVAVTFLMDTQDVALRDGEVRSFTGRASRVVEFDRGNDFGIARYDLGPGDYEFVITASGWDLQRRAAAATSAAASTAAKPSIRKNALPTIR